MVANLVKIKGRCEDCRFYQGDFEKECVQGATDIIEFNRGMKPNDYCSKFERLETETDGSKYEPIHNRD